MVHQRCETSDDDYEGGGQPFLGHHRRSQIVMADLTIVDSFRKMEKLGEEKCKDFIMKRLVDCKTTINERIPIKNKHVFSQHDEKRKQLKLRGPIHLKIS